jgi:phosphohistidine phosphatase
MSRLILLRHAKAERKSADGSDHDRALTGSGRKDSAAAGRLIAERGEKIDLVLSSDSRRTRETWEGVGPQLREKPEVRMLRALYDASDTYLPMLKEEGGDAATILLVGHNPAIQRTAVTLAADLAGRDGKVLADDFPKGALAVFDFDGAWETLRPHRMRLVAFVAPVRD